MKNQSLRVLFFGRTGCEKTQSIVEFLSSKGFETTIVYSSGRDEILPEHVYSWSGEYIFCFRSLYILPRKIIDSASIAAINFHPGPPEYPGSGCINFALYDNASLFGVTAHLMTEKIDDGKILKSERFPIFSNDGVESLLMRTHEKLFDLFTSVVEEISDYGIQHLLSSPLEEHWNGEARRMKEFENLRVISPPVSEEEFLRVIRATNTKMYPTKLSLHGRIFELVQEG